MSTKEAVSIFFDTVNKRDLDAMEAILTDHAQFYFPKARPFVNKGQIIRFFKILFRQYPELSCYQSPAQRLERPRDRQAPGVEGRTHFERGKRLGRATLLFRGFGKAFRDQ